MLGRFVVLTSTLTVATALASVACRVPEGSTLEADTESETIELGAGESVKRHVLYDGDGYWVRIDSRIEGVDAAGRLAVRHVDNDLPDACTASGTVDVLPGETATFSSRCRFVARGDRTIHLENVGPGRLKIIYRTHGQIESESEPNDGTNLELRELRVGLGPGSD